MPDPACELCGDATPARLVRRAPARGWDALCPACWMLNVPGEDSPTPARSALDTAYDGAIAACKQADLAQYQAQMERHAMQTLGYAYGLGRALTPEECATLAQQQALQWQYNVQLSALAETVQLASRPPWLTTLDADALRDVPAAQPPMTPEEDTAWRHSATRLYGTRCVCAVCRQQAPSHFCLTSTLLSFILLRSSSLASGRACTHDPLRGYCFFCGLSPRQPTAPVLSRGTVRSCSRRRAPHPGGVGRRAHAAQR